ncbi:MAG TPA: hypothetical protein VD886_20000 [Herpetosiphonaceae bacterium]|nr:hypothetical protein [Herpetosiphonaceae bacterium]
MSDRPGEQIPTVTADAPAEAREGDYLAPPRVFPGDTMTTARSIALVLLVVMASMQVKKPTGAIFEFQSVGSFSWLVKVAVSIGVLVIQLLAIFKSRTLPTWALWLALAGALAGFGIEFAL